MIRVRAARGGDRVANAITDSSPAPDLSRLRRVQDNALARVERLLLDRLCRALPGWVSPDHLTALGVVGAGITAAGYVGANWSPAFFPRRVPRPGGQLVRRFARRLGRALSQARNARATVSRRPFRRRDQQLDHHARARLLTLCRHGRRAVRAGRLSLHGIYVLLRNQVLGVFQLSFLGCGPTEIRLIIIGFNLAMFALGPVELMILGHGYSLHAMSVGLLGSVLVALFVFNVLKTARSLARAS